MVEFPDPKYSAFNNQGEIKTKVCSSCKQEKGILSFFRSKKSSDGRCRVCKECSKKKMNTKEYVDKWIDYTLRSMKPNDY